jgi:hypothetical protein
MIKEVLSIFLLGFMLFVFVGLICKWQTAKADPFDVHDLVCDKGTRSASLTRLGQLIALCVSTWAVIHEALQGRLSEWLFTFYMIAWVGARLGNLYLSNTVKPVAKKLEGQ